MQPQKYVPRARAGRVARAAKAARILFGKRMEGESNWRERLATGSGGVRQDSSLYI